MRLKELRKAKNISQTEIAKEIGTTQNGYSKYELEQVEPNIETLKKIADYYGVSLDYLCEHETKSVAEFGTLNDAQIMAIKILLQLPESKFFEFLGRLKTIADLYNIKY